MNSNYPHNNGMGNKTSSTDIITNATAFYGALYVAPFVYHATYQFAENMLVEQYGDEYASPILFTHWVFCFFLSFLGIRGALATAIALLSMATGRYGLHFSNLLPMAF